jgi:hypothetical protein
VILYRPVGLEELQLIAEAEYQAFPPRLPEQPIFYPVLNLEYARQIARDWNTKSASHVGFVTRFNVDDEFVSKYPVQIAGSRLHQELWVPAEELAEFNHNIVGRIEVVESHVGAKFDGEIDAETRLPVGWKSK